MNLELKPALGHIFNADTGRCEWCDTMDNEAGAEGPCLGRQATATAAAAVPGAHRPADLSTLAKGQDPVRWV